MLEYLPDSLKTEVVCLAAVKDYGRAFEYVPDSLKTETMCLVALNKTPGALKYVPEKLKTKLSPIYTIRLTDDEIDVINVWAKHFFDRNENKILEINDTIWKKGKEFIIDSFTQSKLINISCIADPYYRISNIEFSENDTKATLEYSAGAGPLCGSYWAAIFSKEKKSWKQIDTQFQGMS